MKLINAFLVVAVLLAGAGVGYCDSNPIAVGTEKLTKMPFTGILIVNEHLFSPVKDVNEGVFTLGNEVRAATVSVALNAGHPVEYED